MRAAIMSDAIACAFAASLCVSMISMKVCMNAGETENGILSPNERS